jgi:hypothetical protein
VRTWELHDPAYARPIAAPLERCAELLGVDSAIVQRAAANVEPYIRVDGKVWSLIRLERQLHAEAYGRVPGRLRQPSTRPARDHRSPRVGDVGPPVDRERSLGRLEGASEGVVPNDVAQTARPAGCATAWKETHRPAQSLRPIRYRRCFFRWDRVQLAAEADQRAGGPVDVPGPATAARASGAAPRQ